MPLDPDDALLLALPPFAFCVIVWLPPCELLLLFAVAELED